ncbi:hypothetical protein [Athalassotoga sp.]|uniref:hypothetical protein n=1 Tax=Athalassotoga sp. TaxID=2022597 RepID=UPI003D03D79E
MERIKSLNFAFNLFLTYCFFSPILSIWGWKAFAGFSIGMIGAELSWFMLNEDAVKIKNGKFRFAAFGAIKRYVVFSIALLIAFSSFSIEGFFSTFIGLEMLTLTLFTSSYLFNDLESKGGFR